MRPAALRPSVQAAHSALAWHSPIFPSVATLPASHRRLNQFESFRDIETWRVLRLPPRVKVSRA
jgi:hypothetical protein